MRIFSRYILGQFIVPVLLSWSVLTGVFLMDQLFLLLNLIITKGIEAQYVFEILLYALPFVMAMSVPLATMSGSMMTFGRLSQDNEIVALRSAGVRLVDTFFPVLVLTLLLAGLMAFFNLYVLPESNHRERNMLADVSSKKPSVKLEEGLFNEGFPGYSIYIGSMDERHSKIYDVMVSVKNTALITAPEGTLEVTPDERYIVMTLYKAETHELAGESYRRIRSDTQVINLELNTELIRSNRSYRSEREMTLPLLMKEIENNKKQIAATEKELAAARNELQKKELERRIKTSKARINVLNVEIHKSLAFAVATILFLFFGASLGGKLRRGGIGLAIVLSLVFFAFYYILVIGGEKLAKGGRIDAWLAMWLPNLVMLPFTAEIFGEVFFENSLLLKRFRL